MAFDSRWETGQQSGNMVQPPYYSPAAGSARDGDRSAIRHEGGAVSAPIHGPAFTYVAPGSLLLPVIIAVPHAGRVYPADTLAQFRDAESTQLRLEDRHVDRLAIQMARLTGAGLLVARAPRAMLDLNRSHDDVDWDMVEGEKGTVRGGAGPLNSGTGRRARSGLGLVPRRLPGSGEIWRSKLPREELDRRIDQIHRPYHAFLTRELEKVRDAWGAALLIDLHSMPPLRRQFGEDRPTRIVLGDRFGASCDPAIVENAFDFLERHRLGTAHNRPYSGGYVLDRHASPVRGIHAIQIEVCRSTYLDARLAEPTEQLGVLAHLLAAMVREIGAHIARLGGQGDFAQAAE